MSETHSLRLEINATGARKGAADFESAIRRIETSVKNLEKNSNAAFSRINQNIKKVNFKQLSDSISQLNSLRLNPAVATNLRNISSAINNIKPINAATVRSITQLGTAISALRSSQAQIRNITNLLNTLNTLRTPANAVRGIQLIATAINNLRAPANTTSIVAALTQITNSANATYMALSRLSRLNVTVRNPTVRGGGGAVNPATGRAYGGVAPGYGFGPGRSSASGMRGFENTMSLSYQAGTAVRGTLGALTAGAFLGQVTNVTREMDLFRVSMTSVGVTAEQTEGMIASLARMSTTLGMDFLATSQNMRQLVTAMVATGVSVQDSQRMFENLAVSMRAAGLGTVQQEGALRAIGQMFGKGRIMAEEFRQQLAEHWTSIAPIMARYLYPEIEDATARMRRMSEDMEKIGFDPRAFVRFSAYLRQELGEGATRQMATMDAAILRLRSNWQLLMKTLGEGEAGKALTRFFERLSAIMQQDSFKTFMEDVGRGLARVLDLIGNAAEFAARNIDLVKYSLLGIAALGSVNLVIGLGRAFTGLLAPITAVGRWLGIIGGGTQVATGAFSTLTNTLGTLLSVGSRVFQFLAIHPFARITLAVVALGTALISSLTSWETFGNDVQKVWDYIVVGAQEAKRTIEELYKDSWLETLVRGYRQAMDTIRDKLKEIQEQSPLTGAALQGAFNVGTLGPFAGTLQNIKELLQWIISNLPNIELPSFPGSGSGPHPDSPFGRQRAGVSIPRNPFRPGSGANRSYPLPDPTQPGPISRWVDRVNEGVEARRGARMNAEEGGRRVGQAGASRAEYGVRQGTDQYGPPVPPISPLSPNERRNLMLNNGRSGGGRGGQERTENYFARLDSGYRVIEEMQDGMNALNEARRRGIGTAQDHVRWEQMIRDRYMEQLGVMDSRTKAERQYESAVRALDAAQNAGLITADRRNQLQQQIADNLEEQRNPVQYMIRQMQEEMDLLNQRNGIYEVENQILQIRNRLRSQGVQISDEEIQRLRTSITAHRAAQQAHRDSQEGMASWANSFRDFGTELAKLEEKFLNQFADALTEFVMTGKANWRDLANSIVSDINNLIIKQGIRELLKWLGLIDGDTAGGFTNGGNGQGLLGNLFGGSGNRSGGGQSGGRGILGEIAGLFGFGGGGMEIAGEGIAKGAEMIGPSMIDMGASAGGEGFWSSISSLFSSFVGMFSEGGISTNPVSAGLVPASAFVGAKHFAQGGFSTGGIPAVLHPEEAVVPLSRGRKIPVEGGGGSRIVNNFNIQTPDAESFRRNPNQVLSGYTRRMARIQNRGG